MIYGAPRDKFMVLIEWIMDLHVCIMEFYDWLWSFIIDYGVLLLCQSTFELLK